MYAKNRNAIVLIAELKLQEKQKDAMIALISTTEKLKDLLQMNY